MLKDAVSVRDYDTREVYEHVEDSFVQFDIQVVFGIKYLSTFLLVLGSHSRHKLRQKTKQRNAVKDKTKKCS